MLRRPVSRTPVVDNWVRNERETSSVSASGQVFVQDANPLVSAAI